MANWSYAQSWKMALPIDCVLSSKRLARKKKLLCYRRITHLQLLCSVPIPDSFAVLGSDSIGASSLRVYKLTRGQTGTEVKEVFSLKNNAAEQKALTGFDFSPKGGWFAYTTEDSAISVINTSDWSKKAFSFKLEGESEATFSVRRLTFDAADQLLACADGGQIKVWDLSKGTIYKHLTLQYPQDLSNLVFAPNKNLISYTTDRTLSHWDLDADRVTASAVSTDFWGNLAYSPDGKILAVGGAENRVRLFDVEHDREVGSLVAPANRDWLMITPEGRLDTSRLEEVEEVYWIVKQEPTKAQPLELFMREFYEPALLPRLLKGEKFNPVDDLSKRNRALPHIEITDITPGGIDKVKVTVLVQRSVSQIQTDSDGHPLDSGAAGLRLFRDGQLVAYSPYDDDQPTHDKPIQLDAEGRAVFTFSVGLPHSLTARKIDFSAYAFNKDRVKSLSTHKIYEIPSSLEAATKGRAYIIAAGVNSTDVNIGELRFAANDATAVKDQLVASFEALDSYSEVVPISLISDFNSDNANKNKRKQGTKQNIQAVFELLAGHPEKVSPVVLKGLPDAKRIHKASPDDLILFFFAGHGFADSSGSSFYLLPSDLGKDIGSDMTLYGPKAISNDDLSLWLRDIDAKDIILVIDACQSAAAVNSDQLKPGPFGNKGLGQLAYDKGMRVLAAAQRSEETVEISSIAHGLLTDALIEDGLVQNKADFFPVDKKIFIGEWLRYGVKRVPEIVNQDDNSQPKQGGSAKTPSAFPEVLHQPVLFDFVWNREDELLRVIH